MIYFIPTPIGNLEDITLRSLRILREVEYIACEDTRTTKKLLDYYDIHKKLISYHKFNEKERIDELINLAIDNDIAVVSDAGMPGISDPGNILINALIEKQLKYTVLPGASAFTTALVMSGFNSIDFEFLGFVPSKKSEKTKFIKNLLEKKHTLIFYETPHRINDTIKELSEFIPNRKIAIVREISKIYEEVKIFLIKDYENISITEKGEFVVIIDTDDTIEEISDEFILKKLNELYQKGKTKKSAVKIITQKYNLNKNRVYELSITT
ncbi:16S rRNA (cytidine(1402)-2'-O)-methyltransferase [Helcococcus ovis]|uniref:Ribosomal RNA small subunit methyltransferase I n=1 Tax=Helcococcus ovis TaxID=72026 RepID=A0A4R9C424_9FIRM|nr:16S rRNA (cytidine(1402)-2'-O)-methyltransferase [Helcococcus ovis]TFF66021.1 16S rRNA (cytidine(1402)-2'-O)-methyltransferase [Helcococcus ovis]TFF66987.1 16S rRNA (cytidine(1402)-2'-O)-methyltransferase [Helcococcus ovis]